MVHLKKLSVGSESVESLAVWQDTQRATWHGENVIIRTTRHKPRRERELLEGGSIYWVIQRRIQCRQEILGLEEGVDEAGQKCCLLILSPQMIRTRALSHRPFQGWRYLEAATAPKDIGPVHLDGADTPPPEEMAQELRALGLIN